MRTDQENERFIRNAEECCRTAEKSIRHEDKMECIRLAEYWLRLADLRRAQFVWPPAEERTPRH